MYIYVYVLGGIKKWFCKTKDFVILAILATLGACQGWQCRVRDPLFVQWKSCSGGLQATGGGEGAPGTLTSEVCKHAGMSMENDTKGEILTDSAWSSCRV